MELTNKANRKKHGQDRMRSRGFLHPRCVLPVQQPSGVEEEERGANTWQHSDASCACLSHRNALRQHLETGRELGKKGRNEKPWLEPFLIGQNEHLHASCCAQDVWCGAEEQQSSSRSALEQEKRKEAANEARAAGRDGKNRANQDEEQSKA